VTAPMLRPASRPQFAPRSVVGCVRHRGRCLSLKFARLDFDRTAGPLVVSRNAPWETTVHEAEIFDIVHTSIMTANIIHPEGPAGVARDQIFRSEEDSRRLALAVIAALETAGFDIIPRTENATST
jgi:hypothetical protein